MLYFAVFALLSLFILFLGIKWMFQRPQKTYYTVFAETDANGKFIFKLYIRKDNGGRQYIGKFDSVEAAKAKITALKEKAAKDAEQLYATTTTTEVYREEM